LQTVDNGVYRIEQQSVTLVLAGDAALGVLAQTCGVDFVGELADRMVYTRVAGASCGVLPREEAGQRVYRLWVDYSLAPYLWKTLAEIAAGLRV
jgi:sarcosine oxidase gamma subunit